MLSFGLKSEDKAKVTLHAIPPRSTGHWLQKSIPINLNHEVLIQKQTSKKSQHS